LLDIIDVALQKAGVQPSEAVMIGDTPYDIAAAKAAGVKCIALRCGGYWDEAALADAAAIFDDPATLLRHWANSPLAG
jgi:phosphoglycolate phosphatase-like HAD superfamily hydrolase